MCKKRMLGTSIVICCICFLGNVIPLHAQKFWLHEWNREISKAMVIDGFSPMLSSRTCTYPNIAAYEVLVYGNPGYLSFKKQLNGLVNLPKPDSKKKYNWTLSAIEAFNKVAEQLIYRKEYCDNLFDSQLKEMGIDKTSEIYKNSMELGDKMAEAILAWAKNDFYAQTKAKPRYIINSAPYAWQPTPPEFKSALEPFWGTLRPFALKSLSEFNCPLPIEFSTDTTSVFYKNAFAVYAKSKIMSEEEKQIAKFWDDNPDQNIFAGHIPTPRRQMNPVSHWMGITQLVCLDKKTTDIESARTYSLVAISMADGFISCFDQKYKSNLIRPVTYIKNYIDQDWECLLVTPPFPEHTSGHSVISSASASVLTVLYGNNFSFTDSSEISFGYKPRKFNSFYDAANEAGISRFYGGIHYMTAIDEGSRQGKLIGDYIVNQIKTKKD